MGSLWNFGMSGMFRTGGKSCKATISTVTRRFRGIPDFVSIEEDGEGGAFVRNQSVLRVERHVGDWLKAQQRGTISIEGTEYIYTMVTEEGDGGTSVVMIYPEGSR